MFTKKEQQQYNRHLILNEIGTEGQEKLKSAKVLMIGAGGLGCPVLQYLAAAGVGTIGIIDHDRIDITNLQRQVLFTHQDIGAYKANVAANRLSQLNPFITFQTYTERLTPSNTIKLFESYDIIVDGTDNFSTRYLINDAAILCKKPVVFGSIHKFEGQVSVFNFQNGPTYRCLYPTAPQADQSPNCSAIGVLGILPGLIGCFQANEVIKLITQKGQPLSGKLLMYNALTCQQNILSFSKNTAIAITKLGKYTSDYCDTSSIEEISFSEYTAHSDEYQLVDIRSSIDRSTDHLGGLHIPLEELSQRSMEIPTTLPVVVYCNSGITSKDAIRKLQKLNFTSPLFNLTGGMDSSC